MREFTISCERKPSYGTQFVRVLSVNSNPTIMKTNIVSSREKNSSTNAKERQANKALAGGKRGDVKTGGRMMGAASKDMRHGLHTDHAASRRSESRRQGYMGSESKGKENRKNI
jgi:hypothetical protein